ncbi:unnamed protein product [Ectocarpus sp. CCAP 1310/34]|nr:unnamed protein product [Ectocarpus sp. CCAP 1310/34]
MRDGESYKLQLGRGYLRAGPNDATGDLGGSVPWGADSKECQQQGENRGKLLSSLAKQASPRPSEEPQPDGKNYRQRCNRESAHHDLSRLNQMQAFSSLPNPSADSGKLAPLDMEQRNPRSHRASRSRQRSSSPKEHQNASSEDESPLPGLSLSPRSGAHSARRVRSLPPTPKRASCTNLDPVSDSVEFAWPQGRGGPAGNGSKFSPLLDAKEGSTSPRYRDPALCAADSNKRSGELAAECGGGGLEREPQRLSRAAEAKSEVGCTRLPGTNPAGGERNDNHRYEGHGERKDFGSVPNSPSTVRGAKRYSFNL